MAYLVDISEKLSNLDKSMQEPQMLWLRLKRNCGEIIHDETFPICFLLLKDVVPIRRENQQKAVHHSHGCFAESFHYSSRTSKFQNLNGLETHFPLTTSPHQQLVNKNSQTYLVTVSLKTCLMLINFICLRRKTIQVY